MADLASLHRRRLLALLWPSCLLVPVKKAKSQVSDALGRAERALFTAVNDTRRREGLPPLAWSDDLAVEAKAHSESMARGGFFSHDDPRRGSFSQRMARARLGRAAIAENLYQERGQKDRVAATVRGWLDSPGHRTNLLNPRYTETGVGLSLGRDGTSYATQIYATAAAPRQRSPRRR